MFETRTEFIDSLFYDVSSWTLPLAFNMDYDLDFPIKKLNTNIEKINFEINYDFSKSNYAYLMEYHEYLTPKALNKLLENNIIVKVSTRPFTLEGKEFDYGTILIPVLNNDPDKLYAIVKEISKESMVKIQSVKTGYAEGPDLGSSYFKRLRKKNIGLLVGDGVTSYDAGEIWHLLDTRYDVKVNKLDLRNIERIDLGKYTTIIVPNSTIKNTSITKKIFDWVENGGVIIGYKNSINWLEESKLLKVDKKDEKLIAKNISFKDKTNFYGAQRIGGAIFETNIDRSHPINYGQTNSTMPIFRNSTIFLNVDEKSYNNPIRYTVNPLLSGYISEENLEQLKSTTPIKIQKISKGKVIYLTDNTNFRAFWYGTNKILMNAIFFSSMM
tara:strand:- start:1002 stop:2153 length:1152 start_codon:yes stop_codon:yes gene_type:complete